MPDGRVRACRPARRDERRQIGQGRLVELGGRAHGLLREPQRRAPHGVGEPPGLPQRLGDLVRLPPELVGDHGPGTGQGVLQHGGPGGDGHERERLGALGQDGPRPGGEVLHGGDPGHGRHDGPRHELGDGLREVGERRVHVGVADGREGHRRVLAQQFGDPLPGGVPRGLAPGPVAALVQREHDPDDLVPGHVVQHGRLGPAALPAVHHGDHHDIGLPQGAHALDGHQLRIPGAHPDSDQLAAHDVRHLSTNRRATPGSDAQCVCR